MSLSHDHETDIDIDRKETDTDRTVREEMIKRIRRDLRVSQKTRY